MQQSIDHMEDQFDYALAMAELEKIAQKVEDPSTALDDVEKYIRRSDELIAKCREYLRTMKTKTETL